MTSIAYLPIAKDALSAAKSLENLLALALTSPTSSTNSQTLRAMTFFELSKSILGIAKTSLEAVQKEIKIVEKEVALSAKDSVVTYFIMLQKMETTLVACGQQISTTLRLVRKSFDTPFDEKSVQECKQQIISCAQLLRSVLTIAMELEATHSSKHSSRVPLSIYHSAFTSYIYPDSYVPPASHHQELKPVIALEAPTREEEIEVEKKRSEENTSQGDDREALISGAIEAFNKRFKDGIRYLIERGLAEDSPKSIAEFLIKYNDRIDKHELGELLGGNAELDIEITREFTSMLDFKGITLVQALRKYLVTFMLPGEAQKISRLMETFAGEYLKQNPGALPNADIAFVLSFSLIMLNTDAHNMAIAPKDKMTKEQFIRNNRGTWVDGADPPVELLSKLYDEIVENEIKMQTHDNSKQGWAKSVKAGNAFREGRTWLFLEGNRLKVFREQPPKGEKPMELAYIDLDYVQVKENEAKMKFMILSALPRDIDFYVLKKDKHVKASAKEFVVTAETPVQAKQWSIAVRQSVSFERLEELEKKVDEENKGKGHTVSRGLPPMMHTKSGHSWRNTSAAELIGNTPLVELSRLSSFVGLPPDFRLLAKVEFLNPGLSKKDRIALSMIEKAEKEGLLTPGQTIIELTSGNTGTGLAIVCAVKVMSEGNSIERARMMRALGATVVLVPQAPGSVKGQVSGEDIKLVEAKAKELTAELNAFRADQFRLDGNYLAHETGTAAEIWKQTNNQGVDAFVDFVGSGGTFIGTAKGLKTLKPSIKCFVVEPENAAILGEGAVVDPNHRIQGGGYSLKPDELQLGLIKNASTYIDGYITISDEEAIAMARLLATKEGLFCGFSSGANAAAAVKVAKSDPSIKSIVFLLCDSGLKYLSTDLWE